MKKKLVVILLMLLLCICMAAPAFADYEETITAAVGETITLTSKAALSGASYTWYRDGDELGKYTRSISVVVTSDMDGTTYDCEAENDDGDFFLTTYIIEVQQSAPVITQQPKSVTVDDGTYVSFTVSASNVSAYKWFYTKDGGASWHATSMSGYNTATVTVQAIPARTGYMYKCRITGLDGTVIESSPATLTVIQSVTKVDITASDAVVGEMVTFTASVDTDASYIAYYQWYINGQLVSTTTESSYSVECDYSLHGAAVRCRVWDLSNTLVTSGTVVLDVSAGKLTIPDDPYAEVAPERWEDAHGVVEDAAGTLDGVYDNLPELNPGFLGFLTQFVGWIPSWFWMALLFYLISNIYFICLKFLWG